MTSIVSDERRFNVLQAQYSLNTEEIRRDDAAVNERAGPHANVGHAVTRDQMRYAKSKPSMLDYLRHAQAKSGRSPAELVREFFRLKRGRGKLTLPEYVQYGVYDKTRNRPVENRDLYLTRCTGLLPASAAT